MRSLRSIAFGKAKLCMFLAGLYIEKGVRQVRSLAIRLKLKFTTSESLGLIGI